MTARTVSKLPARCPCRPPSPSRLPRSSALLRPASRMVASRRPDVPESARPRRGEDPQTEASGGARLPVRRLRSLLQHLLFTGATQSPSAHGSNAGAALWSAPWHDPWVVWPATGPAHPARSPPAPQAGPVGPLIRRALAAPGRGVGLGWLSSRPICEVARRLLVGPATYTSGGASLGSNPGPPSRRVYEGGAGGWIAGETN